MYRLIILTLIFSISSISTSAQTNDDLYQAQKKLTQSLQEGASDTEIANGYVKTAQQLLAQQQYSKAEDYYKRAKKLYEKQNNKSKVSEVDREIAKTLEAQGKVNEAINHYNDASKTAENKTQKAINANDANRLTNKENPAAQSNYIRRNIDLLQKSTDTENKVSAYRQMADVNMEMDNKGAAIENLNRALKEAKEKSQIIEINRDIARVYISDNQLEKAIEINEEIVKEADDKKDVAVKIEQLQSLSTIYFDNQNKTKGLESLIEAYQLAIKEGRTIDAQRSLKLLANYYSMNNNSKEALALYTDFMDNLETIISTDSTLIDAKLFLATEEKITQLEKERNLNNELIEKKNTLNYVLIGSIILALIFLLLISKVLYSIKAKNKRIALQSLRREMNPHFIFNSLNSVNQFIAQNNELEANKYLSSYSKLMRNIMENSNKDFISLSTEIEQMNKYLDLEHMRFKDKFSYQIDIDESLDTDAIFVPNMLIQPHLENSIWHGLRYKEANGWLCLSIENKGNYLLVRIEDNGIGLKKSQEIKTKNQKIHKSRGQNNTLERISLLNRLYNINITINVSDKEGSETGVIVLLTFPINQKLKTETI